MVQIETMPILAYTPKYCPSHPALNPALTVVVPVVQPLEPQRLLNIGGFLVRIWPLPIPPQPKLELPEPVQKLIGAFLLGLDGFTDQWWAAKRVCSKETGG